LQAFLLFLAFVLLLAELRQQHFAEGKTDTEEGEKKSNQLPKFDVYKGFFHF